MRRVPYQLNQKTKTVLSKGHYEEGVGNATQATLTGFRVDALHPRDRRHCARVGAGKLRRPEFGQPRHGVGPRGLLRDLGGIRPQRLRRLRRHARDHLRRPDGSEYR